MNRWKKIWEKKFKLINVGLIKIWKDECMNRWMNE